jgi:flagellar protein FlbD
MIRLTRLNEAPFYLNCDLIEYIEETPDTVVTLSNGGKLRVKEPAATVVERIIEYRRGLSGRRKLAPPHLATKDQG